MDNISKVNEQPYFDEALESASPFSISDLCRNNKMSEQEKEDLQIQNGHGTPKIHLGEDNEENFLYEHATSILQLSDERTGEILKQFLDDYSPVLFDSDQLRESGDIEDITESQSEVSAIPQDMDFGKHRSVHAIRQASLNKNTPISTQLNVKAFVDGEISTDQFLLNLEQSSQHQDSNSHIEDRQSVPFPSVPAKALYSSPIKHPSIPPIQNDLVQENYIQLQDHTLTPRQKRSSKSENILHVNSSRKDHPQAIDSQTLTRSTALNELKLAVQNLETLFKNVSESSISNNVIDNNYEHKASISSCLAAIGEALIRFSLELEDTSVYSVDQNSIRPLVLAKIVELTEELTMLVKEVPEAEDVSTDKFHVERHGTINSIPNSNLGTNVRNEFLHPEDYLQERENKTNGKKITELCYSQIIKPNREVTGPNWLNDEVIEETDGGNFTEIDETIEVPFQSLMRKTPAEVKRILRIGEGEDEELLQKVKEYWESNEDFDEIAERVEKRLRERGVKLERKKRMGSDIPADEKKAIRAQRNRERSQALRKHHKERIKGLECDGAMVRNYNQCMRSLIYCLLDRRDSLALVQEYFKDIEKFDDSLLKFLCKGE